MAEHADSRHRAFYRQDESHQQQQPDAQLVHGLKSLSRSDSIAGIAEGSVGPVAPTSGVLRRRRVSIERAHSSGVTRSARLADLSDRNGSPASDILFPVNRRRIRFAAWFALLAVFLAQLAIAAYACPLMEAALTPSEPRVEVPTPCAEMGMAVDEDAFALCVEHCNSGGQLVDNHSPVADAAAVPLILPFVATFVNAPARASVVEPILARATAPPVLASSSRLRI
ncbi:MAG TPA: hypothetical protein VNG69_16985 [Casimicrobiaceae bacterium]|nr:hypothetical protein [Casimicrobiaceae bacterium]